MLPRSCSPLREDLARLPQCSRARLQAAALAWKKTGCAQRRLRWPWLGALSQLPQICQLERVEATS